MTLPAPIAADPVRLAAPPKAEQQVTLTGCFAILLRRLIPTPAAYAGARAIALEVADAMRAALYPTGMKTSTSSDMSQLIVGAVGKRIAIAPIKMVDLLCVLPPRLSVPRVADAVMIVAALLKERFGDVSLREESGIVVERGAINVRVWPARKEGAGFLMPGPATLMRASGWSVTNPVAEAATLRLSDSLYGGRPRLLLAALKAWRLHAAVPIPSFALEVLVQDFYAAASRPLELDAALAEFWGWMSSRAGAALRPPGGRSAVDIGSDWRGKAKSAYWRAALAEHHLKERRLIDAAVEWRQTLGPAFPVPGESPLRALPLFKRQRG
jgi:hypothetical protein